MRVEAGEKRVFLPELINAINDMGLHVYIEEGYGSRLGYTFDSSAVLKRFIAVAGKKHLLKTWF